jgi:3-phosphoshikimate 1-carboxyvinyltransferase
MHCNGLQTLRIKETDRIAALDNELQKLGLASLTEIDSNNWQLLPTKLTTQDTVLTTISTYEDHRMAMAFAPLALKLNAITIEEPSVVTKSYPMFWKDIEKLGFVITTKI